MNKKVIFSILVITITAIWLSRGYSLEETFTDTSAGVDVAPVFYISLDKTEIDFGPMQAGQKKRIEEETHFNQIACRSNHGKTWYLKVHLLSPLKHIGRDIKIPAENLRWNVLDTKGEGNILNPYKFNAFTISPGLIYTSAGDDNLGKEVKFQFQYELATPSDVIAGVYIAQILFTLTESP